MPNNNNSEFVIRDVQQSDAESIISIYNEYIANTVISFEEEAVTVDGMKLRIEKNQKNELPYIVMTNAVGKLQGYAYATPWRERSAYRYTVEVSIYLGQETQGKGLGTTLYQALFDKLALTKSHVALGCITIPNEASVALHEKMGMEKIAHFSQVGYKFDEWIDVGYWQRVL